MLSRSGHWPQKLSHLLINLWGFEVVCVILRSFSLLLLNWKCLTGHAKSLKPLMALSWHLRRPPCSKALPEGLKAAETWLQLVSLLLLHCLIYSTPAVPWDYATVALETSNPCDTGKLCKWDHDVSLATSWTDWMLIFVFLDMGVLFMRQKKAKMRFYEKFLLSLDAMGNFIEVLSNVSLAGLAMLLTGFQTESQRPAELVSPGMVWFVWPLGLGIMCSNRGAL